MGWIERRPHDVTTQLVGYAETGRLIEGPRTDRDDQRGTIAIVVVAALILGASAGVATTCTIANGNPTMILIALIAGLGAIAVLIPAIRLLRITPAGKPVKVRPAAVLPPELVRVGNWIHRDGAWQRVEHIGRDGGGRIHALLSSGDVAELTTPTTIAGDDFRPTHDPVASLRH